MKAARTAHLMIALMMLTAPLLPLLGAAGPRAAPMVVTAVKEWTSETFNGTPELLWNDTDHDGVEELIAWGNLNGVGLVRVYDFPGYYVSWSYNFSGDISLELADINDNGTTQLIIQQTGLEGVNITVVSGKTFANLWTSPTFAGSLLDRETVDIDGDGTNEFVWLNQSMVGDRLNFTYDTRLHIYSTATFQAEWESPNLVFTTDSFDTARLDADPALELVLRGYNQTQNGTTITLYAYDGATHGLQWNVTADANTTSFSTIFFGDVDKDSASEIVVNFDEQNDSFGNRAGFFIYSGNDGALEWNLTLGNYTPGSSVADIDADGAMELLATGEVGVRDFINNTNVTHYVYDLKDRTESWHLGPFQMGIMDNSMVGSQELNNDSVPELVITNRTMDMMTFNSVVNYTVIDGKTLALKWRSPDFHGYGVYLMPVPLDSDPQLELVIADSWLDAGQNIHGIVHVYRTDTYQEEWTSGDLQTQVYAMAGQAVNDSRFELVLSVSVIDIANGTQSAELRMLDTQTYTVIWTSPLCNNLDLGFDDVVGTKNNEILFAILNETRDDETGRTFYNSTLMLYNDTTFKLSWSSPEIPARTRYEKAGDIDADGKGEVLISKMVEDADWNTFVNLTAFEFTEGPSMMPDLAITPDDLLLSSTNLVVAMPVTLTVHARNLGDLDVAACCVTLLVDNIPAGTRTVSVAALNSTDTVFNWTAVLGNHTLTVKLDPANLIPELNETNNIASHNVTVLTRPRPEARITSPREGGNYTEGASITFNGTKSIYAPDVTPNFYWESDLTGLVGNSSLFNATLPVGEHTVTLYVDDGSYNSSASVNISVQQAPPPPGTTWAMITSPKRGASYAAGDSLLFDGTKSTAARAEYTLAFEWRSDLSGIIGTAPKFTRTLLPGDHNISLTVDDGHGGKSSAAVSIRVKPIEGVVAIITSPLDGQVFEVTQSVTLNGTNSTGPSGAVLNFVWSSNLMGTIGSSKVESRRLSAGNHTITLNVYDDRGHTGQASVNITVKRSMDYAPSVTVISPLPEASLVGNVTINGTAWDDALVTAVYLRIDNGSWLKLSGTDNWTYVWDTSKVKNGTHRLSLKASDEFQSSPEVTINVIVANPPVPKPPKPPVDDKSTQTMMLVGALVVIFAIVGAVGFMMTRRRTPPPQRAPPAPAPIDGGAAVELQPPADGSDFEEGAPPEPEGPPPLPPGMGTLRRR